MMVSDVWFRSRMEIPEIFEQITGFQGHADAENRYEWVTGKDPVTGASLNISRDHKQPVEETDVHVSFGTDLSVEENDLKSIVNRCRKLALGSVYAGFRSFVSGHEWKTDVVREYERH